MRRGLFVVGALALSLPCAASGQDRSLRITNLDVQLAVNSDGTVDVTERQNIQFTGRWSRIQRNLSFGTPTNGHPPPQISRVSATDAEGQPLRTEVYPLGRRNSRGPRIGIWVTPYPMNEERTLFLRYRLTNAVRSDELVWSINYFGVPIGQAQVVVVLPTGAAPTRTVVYTRDNPSRHFIPALTPGARVMADATIETNGNNVGITLPHGMSAAEIVTIFAALPPGTIHPAIKAPQKPGSSPIQWWPLLIPLTVFAAAFVTWWKRSNPEGSYSTRYEPADDMSPAELGTLVDDTVDGVDLTATLVDLAARGFLRIEEITERRPGELARSTDYIVHVVCTRQYGIRLKAHEQLFLHALSNASGTAKTVRTSLLRRQFVWPKEIRNAIYDSLISNGYFFARPDKVKNLWKVAAALTTVFGTPLVFLAFRYRVAMISPVPVATAAALSALILLLFSRIMPARTTAGTRTREAALGLKDFLGRVTDPHNTSTMKSPEMFQRYLPYAIALGVAGNWSKAFDDLYGGAPKWYVGATGQFRASSFSRSIGSMARVAGSAGR